MGDEPRQVNRLAFPVPARMDATGAVTSNPRVVASLKLIMEILDSRQDVVDLIGALTAILAHG